MSYFEDALKAHLQADSAIAALVSERIHPLILGQKSPTPAITYSIVFGEPVNSLDGFTSGLTRYSVQIDCWSQTFDRTRELAAAVAARLNTPAETFKSVIRSAPTLEDYESDTKYYRRSIDASCWYTAPA